MPEPFDWNSVFASGVSELPHFGTLAARIALATLLGGGLAFRIWRRVLPLGLPPSRQIAEAQTLIAIVGVIMVVVLGDHPARAFGLVGLGSFIRFRAGISDPRDASLTLFMIGIGMACGLGLTAMAVGATALVGLVLMLFDASERGATRPTLVTVNASDPSVAWRAISPLFPKARVIELSNNAPELGKGSGRLMLQVDLRGDMDAARLRELFTRHEVPGILRVALSLEDQ